MQFINSSLKKLERNLADDDFKYLTEEFGSKNLKLLKQKVLILMSTWKVSKDLTKKNCPTKSLFTGQKKLEQLVIMGKN